jgi:hypothetical protein
MKELADGDYYIALKHVASDSQIDYDVLYEVAEDEWKRMSDEGFKRLVALDRSGHIGLIHRRLYERLDQRLSQAARD